MGDDVKRCHCGKRATYTDLTVDTAEQSEIFRCAHHAEVGARRLPSKVSMLSRMKAEPGLFAVVSWEHDDGETVCTRIEVLPVPAIGFAAAQEITRLPKPSVFGGQRWPSTVPFGPSTDFARVAQVVAIDSYGIPFEDSGYTLLRFVMPHEMPKDVLKENAAYVAACDAEALKFANRTAKKESP